GERAGTAPRRASRHALRRRAVARRGGEAPGAPERPRAKGDAARARRLWPRAERRAGPRPRAPAPPPPHALARGPRAPRRLPRALRAAARPGALGERRDGRGRAAARGAPA